MQASPNLQAASDRLLELATQAGLRHAVGCAALLELIATGDAVNDALRTELCRQEVSQGGFGVLVLLEQPHDEPVGTSDLAHALNLSAAAVSEILARLELAGLIRRARREGNRRHNTIELTAHGRETLTGILRHLESEVQRLTRPLSPEELQALRQSCARLRPNSDHQPTT